MCPFNVLLVTDLYAWHRKYLKTKSNSNLIQVNQKINLMFCSEESKGPFRFKNNTVYELQSIKLQFSTKFKCEYDGKVDTHISCVSIKLQINYKRSLDKAVIKHFCKISFKDFGNKRNPKICMHVFSGMIDRFWI